jgi:glutaredoxin-related protein
MKITNKKEYLEAICVRHDLKRDIKEFRKYGTSPMLTIAESLVDVLNLMITCYENGADTNLTITLEKK